jgi:hypothetical protein
MALPFARSAGIAPAPFYLRLSRATNHVSAIETKAFDDDVRRGNAMDAGTRSFLLTMK